MGAGVGVPGTVDRKAGTVMYSNNLRWENVPLAEMLGRFLPIPIQIANDADCAALGEAVAGTGLGYQNLVMVTLGTGVGGGVGGLRRVGGREALLQRVLFRLTARRGSFPFREDLGSRLWELGRVSAPERRSAARQYVTEALEAEPVSVEDVDLEQGRDGTAAVTVYLRYEGEDLPVTVEVRP